MSAWIEIHHWPAYHLWREVALLVSAWIEINHSRISKYCMHVALLVSAWIEIETLNYALLMGISRTPRECVD